MVSSLPSYINKAAALRLLGFASRIEHLRKMANGAIQCTYLVAKKRCSTFISRHKFLVDASLLRRFGAQFVKVKKWASGSYTNHFDAKSPDSQNSYTVRVWGDAVDCECPEYEKQTERPRQSCKHAIAVLGFLGHNSLSEMLAHRKAEETARILAVADAARESIFAF